MSGVVFGADVEALDVLADRLDAAGGQVRGLLGQSVGPVSLSALGAGLDAVWRGPSASSFAGVWQSRHLLKLVEIEQMLGESARVARQNAAHQRQTSEALGPSTGSPGPGGSTSSGSDPLDEGDRDSKVQALADLLGIPNSVAGDIVDKIGDSDKTAKALEEFLEFHKLNPKVLKTLGKAGKAIGAANVVSDFVTDFLAQTEKGLPLDEVLVHAVSRSVGPYVIEEGVSHLIAGAVTTAIAASTFGIGAVPGFIIGKVAGEVVSWGLGWAADEFGGYDLMADYHLDQYRMAKEAAIALYEIGAEVVEFVDGSVTAVVDGVEWTVDAAGNLVSSLVDTAGEVVDGAADLGGIVIDETTDLAEDIAAAGADLAGDAWNAGTSWVW